MEKWVEALRFGKYKQGQGLLCKKVNEEFRYCCLGVLCEILGYPKQSGEFEIVYYNYRASELPDSVRNITEMSSKVGMFIDSDGIQNSLANLNDRGHSFLEIADIIEANYKNI